MNKLLTKIVGAALGTAMAVGVGVAVASSNRGFESAKATTVGSTYTVSATSATSISNNGLYVLKCNNTSDGFSGSISSDWGGVTTTTSSYFILKAVGSTSGFTLEDYDGTNGYIYCSAAKKMAWHASSKTTFTLMTGKKTTTISNAVGNSTIGTLQKGASGIRPYTSATGADFQLFSVSISSKTLSSITLSGSMTKTSYTTAESWNPAGLVVTGTYSDSSTDNLTSEATFSYFNSSNVEKATPNAFGICSNETLKVVAHYNGVSDTAKYVATETLTITKAPEFKLVTDATKLTKGTTAIIVGTGTYSANTYTKAMIATYKTSNGSFGSNADVTLSDGFNANSVATSASATVFTLGGSAGAWTLTNGDNRLGFTGTSNNNIQFNELLTDTFTISSPDAGTYVTINSNTHSGRGLRMNVNNGSPLFSNYGSGNQQPVYLFADIAEATYGTTDHIDVATLPQTHWHVGQTFSDAGIVINAWDSSDDSGNSKIVETYTTSIPGIGSGVAFTDNDIGSHTVTVTYTEGGNDYTDTYDIYVYATAEYQLVTEEPSGGWSGTYLITSAITGSTQSDKISDGTYAMRSTGENLDYVGNYDSITPVTSQGVTSVSTGQEFQFSIATMTGGYSIQGKDGKYIGWGSSSSNGMTSSNSALLNTFSISEGNVTILCSAGTKGLKLDKSSGQFRYYSNPVVQLYKLVESTEAIDYANDFLDTLKGGVNPVCKVTDQGVVQTDLDDLKAAWELLATSFDGLSTNAIKQQFTQGTADENSDDPIEQALALYDHIATVYGTRLESVDCPDYNFMGRSITPVGSIRTIVSTSNSANVALVVSVISIVSLTAIGGYFLLRKKKEQ